MSRIEVPYQLPDSIEQNIILNAFRIAINGSLVKYNMIDGIMDEFEDESGVDTGESIDEKYDSTDDFYSPGPTGEVVESNTDVDSTTNIGDVDDNEVRKAQSFKLSETTTVSSVKLTLGASTGSPSGQMTLRIETDSSGPSGTLANANATKAITPTASQANEWEFATPFELQADTTYWIVLVCDSQSTNVYWTLSDKVTGTYADGAEALSLDSGSTWFPGDRDMWFEIYHLVTGTMTLVSTSNEAETQPDNVRAVIMEEDVDAVTINTDLKAYASRDNGANWVQGTLADEGDYGTGKRILVASVDVSGQASDKTMKWKIETLNNKDLKIHGIGLLWD